MDLKELLSLISADEDVEEAAPKPSDLMIRRLEKALNAKLPGDYLNFMKAFNGGNHRFAYMYPIVENAQNFMDEWWTFREGIPEIQEGKVIPFGNDYSGAYFCFDMREGAENPPVVLLESWSGPDDEFEFQAESFLEFAAQAYREPNVEKREIVLRNVTSLREAEETSILGMDDFGLRLRVLSPLSAFSEADRSPPRNDFYLSIASEPAKLFAFSVFHPVNGQTDFEAKEGGPARLKVDTLEVKLMDSNASQTGKVIQSGGVQLPGESAYTLVYLLQSKRELQGTEDLRIVFEVSLA